MSGERDPQEVVCLALMPVHAGEHLLQRRYGGIVFRHAHDQTARVVVLQRAQLVHHVEARLIGFTIRPVDRGDVQRYPVATVGVIPQQRAHLYEPLASDPHRLLPVGDTPSQHRVGKLARDELGRACAVHRAARLGLMCRGHGYPSSEPGRSRAIFFCSLMMASSRPSGRGGQPVDTQGFQAGWRLPLSVGGEHLDVDPLPAQSAQDLLHVDRAAFAAEDRHALIRTDVGNPHHPTSGAAPIPTPSPAWKTPTWSAAWKRARRRAALRWMSNSASIRRRA